MAKFDVDAALIRKLAGLIEETGLDEIEVADGERRVRVARRGGPSVTAAAPPPVESAPTPPVPPAAAPAEEAVTGHIVTAPMVGVIYYAPEPGAEPFVRVGETVSDGQTLFLIEAMKTFNPVRAPRAGTVTRILVPDGAPVEFGEELLILE